MCSKNKLVIVSVSGSSTYLYKLQEKKNYLKIFLDEVNSFIKYIVSLELINGVIQKNKEKVKKC